MAKDLDFFFSTYVFSIFKIDDISEISLVVLFLFTSGFCEVLEMIIFLFKDVPIELLLITKKLSRISVNAKSMISCSLSFL
jgi:hypothetical protein